MKIVYAMAALLALSYNAAAAVTVEAPKGTYALDPTHASLHWKVNHLGLSNYTGRFTAMQATLQFDPAAPAASTLEVTVDPTSLETDYPNPEKKDFDGELIKGDKYFNTDVHPTIRFVSTKIEPTGERTAKLHGDLTLLGQTKPITLDVTYNGSMKEHPYAKTGAIGFSATGVIKRSEWGMTHLVPYVGDDVTLLIEAEFLEKK